MTFSVIDSLDHSNWSPWTGFNPTCVDSLPHPVLQIEGVDIVEVLALLEVVVEAAEQPQPLLNHHHAVATPSRRGAARLHLGDMRGWVQMGLIGPHLLPPPGGEVEAPEVPVVVELGLGGRGELPSEDPQLSPGLDINLKC